MEREKNNSVLLVLTGPTCAGKDVLIEELQKRNSNLARLVTTNSRKPRAGEVNGRDYYFVSRADFERMIANGEFLEWVEYRGEYRGGQKKHIEEALASGKDVVWRIDVRGVMNIKEKVEEMIADPKSPVNNVLFVFLMPPDLETLKRRMEKRGTETEKEQKSSLRLAKWEIKQAKHCDYIVMNADSHLSDAVRKVEKLMNELKL